MTYLDEYADGYSFGLRDGQAQEREKWRELVREIADSHPVFDHAAIDYVTIQVDRRWLKEAKEALDEGNSMS